MISIPQEAVGQANAFAAMAKYQKTWLFQVFLRCTEDVIAAFCGNQAFKTSAFAYNYVLRILGWHPVATKNVVYWKCTNDHPIVKPWKDGYQYVVKEVERDIYRQILCFNSMVVPKSNTAGSMTCPDCGGNVVMHQRGKRIYRFGSESLPGQTGQVERGDGTVEEVKNTQYPEFLKWMPKFLITKDITYRNMAMTVTDPFGGDDIIVEYVGYSQPAPGRGVQRMSIWQDEQSPRKFYDEQFPRLFAEQGDMLFSLTPEDEVTYMYDEIYEKASVYYRTQLVCDELTKDRPQDPVQRIERTDSPNSIAVLQAATDDNPTLSKQFIEKTFGNIDDPDLVAIRRFGLFKQISGRIYKQMSMKTHRISKEKYLPDGPNYTWHHYRMIDYHEKVAWAVCFASLSPRDELFCWFDYNPSPESMVTSEIAYHIAVNSKDFRYKLNLMDPLAVKQQSNTGTSVLDDMNTLFKDYRREDVCTGGVWESWDTKSTRGRDKVRERLKNSLIAGRPFNNSTMRDGRRILMPTIWFLDTLNFLPRSIKQWRMNKEKPEQNHSHFPMCLEALLKDKRFKIPRQEQPQERKSPRYFQGRR